MEWMLRSLMICIFVGSNIAAGVIYVDSSALSGLKDGGSWDNAFVDLQSALGSSRFGDEIWIAEGTYKPTSDTDRTAFFSLKSGIGLYGGFAGTETTKIEREYGLYRTILSGDIGISGDSTDNSKHVIIGDEVLDCTLDGICVKDGMGENGAGLSASSMFRLNIENCFFERNMVTKEGGAIAVFGNVPDEPSELVIRNCVFSKNVAAGGGAYFATDGVKAEFFACRFEQNSTGTTDDGGALFLVEMDSSNFTNCIFNGNTARFGGVVSMGSICSAVMTNCILVNNQSVYEGSIGYCETDCQLIITNSIMKDNVSGHDVVLNTHNGSRAIVTYSCMDFYKMGDGNIQADPGFVDFIAGNFRLEDDSPCKDAADGDAAPVLDVEGLPRFDDPGIINTGIGSIDYSDMGLYENQTQTTAPVDTVTPFVTYVLSRGTTAVEIGFSKMMAKEYCVNPSNYTIDNGIIIDNVYLKYDRRSVLLKTSPQPAWGRCNLAISGLIDASSAGNPLQDTTFSIVSKPVVVDDFEHGFSAIWDTAFIGECKLVQSMSDSAAAIMHGMFQLVTVEDYGEFTLLFEIARASAWNVVFFGMTDTNNYYGVKFHQSSLPETKTVIHVVDGVEEVLFEFPDVLFLNEEEFMQISICCDTATGRLRMLYEPYEYALFDTVINNLSAGKIVFGSDLYGGPLIDNVKIEREFLPSPLYQYEQICINTRQVSECCELSWNPEYETDTKGWNVLRSASSSGAYTKLNDSLITATGSGVFFMTDYHYVDSSIVPGTYFYKIEQVKPGIYNDVYLRSAPEAVTIADVGIYDYRKFIQDIPGLESVLVENGRIILIISDPERFGIALFSVNGILIGGVPVREYLPGRHAVPIENVPGTGMYVLRLKKAENMQSSMLFFLVK